MQVGSDLGLDEVLRRDLIIAIGRLHRGARQEESKSGGSIAGTAKRTSKLYEITGPPFLSEPVLLAGNDVYLVLLKPSILR